MTATTSAQTPIQRIVEIITVIAEARFDAATVDHVDVIENGDQELLSVRVIVRDDATIPGSRMTGFIREIREALEERANEFRFPVVSYVPKSEVEEKNAEAC